MIALIRRAGELLRPRGLSLRSVPRFRVKFGCLPEAAAVDYRTAAEDTRREAARLRNGAPSLTGVYSAPAEALFFDLLSARLDRNAMLADLRKQAA